MLRINNILGNNDNSFEDSNFDENNINDADILDMGASVYEEWRELEDRELIK